MTHKSLPSLTVKQTGSQEEYWDIVQIIVEIKITGTQVIKRLKLKGRVSQLFKSCPSDSLPDYCKEIQAFTIIKKKKFNRKPQAGMIDRKKELHYNIFNFFPKNDSALMNIESDFNNMV